MKEPAANTGLTLRHQMLIFTFGIIVVLMGLSLSVIHAFVKPQVHREVVQDLEKTQLVFERFMLERASWLHSQCGVVAEDPRFTAILDIDHPDPAEHVRTVLPIAREFQNLISSDLFIVTNQIGLSLARIEVSRTTGDDLRNMPNVLEALAGQSAAGTWQLGGQTYYTATVPILQAERPTGTLSVGFLQEVETEDLIEYLAMEASKEPVRKVLSLGDINATAALVEEFQLAFGSDLVAVTDGVGRTVDLLVSKTSFDDDLSTVPGVQDALQGREYRGLQADRGRLFQMVVVPVWSQDRIIGTLSSGFAINDQLARDLRTMTHSEVSFALAHTIVASTRPADLQQELEQLLRQQGTPPPERLIFETELGEETYLSLAGVLDVGTGRESVLYLIQLSLDQATSFLTELESTLLLIGIGVLVVAALISFPGVSRIAKPVQALVESTRRLAAGELTHRIPIVEGGEIGALASSFNEMAAALSRSRDALAESERRYRDLFDNAHDPVYTTDRDMKLTSVNKAVLESLRYTEEELIGQSLYDLLVADDAERLKNQDRRLAPGQPRPVIEAEFLCKDGRRATLEVVSRWIIQEGDLVGTHGIGRDITQRRDQERATNRFREQLHQAEKLRALGEMAAGVAHNSTTC